MIKANELRIGNWVMAYEPIIVNCVSVDGINMTIGFYSGNISVDYDLDVINPIPLSPEILEKAGFEYESATTLAKEGFPVYFKVWNKSVKSSFAFYLNEQVEVPCLYIHQLQNLYLALTGNELEINL